MKYRKYETVNDTLKEWERQLNISTKSIFRRNSTDEDTLKNWAIQLNNMNNKSSIVFRTYTDTAQTISEWEKLLNKIF